MDLLVVFARYQDESESYIEALDVMDEYGFEQNPDWLLGKLKEARTEEHYADARIFRFRLSPQGVTKIDETLDTGIVDLSIEEGRIGSGRITEVEEEWS